MTVRVPIAVGVLGMALAWLPVGEPVASAYAGTPIPHCGTIGPSAVAEFSTMAGTFPGVTSPDLAIDRVTLSELSASCNGDVMQLTLQGNRTGNPLAPATLTLSSADSSLDPCTQAGRPAPLVVSHGEIALDLCASGGPAGFADLRELTEISLEADGVPVPVSLGAATAASPSSGQRPPAQPRDLAFTGADLTHMVALGTVGVAAGLLGVALARRQQNRRA